ncbi:hypothetical protein CgunFtcFv8_012317 [Champsocephalus gunnari]|uniref:Uncharacterized protein n=1 Tax=Champsocephalus gunnari TaxID=52237 RepID=A0AAN8D765_CHAGU|nr:hypothetical protein CgunFtcFv8_012317 [Champsocephalus gunnari]
MGGTGNAEGQRSDSDHGGVQRARDLTLTMGGYRGGAEGQRSDSDHGGVQRARDRTLIMGGTGECRGPEIGL